MIAKIAGEGHALPGHCERKSEKEKWPGGTCEVDEISGRRENDEDEKGAATTEVNRPTIRRILVNRVEKVFCRAEQSDDRGARPECFKIFRQAFLPEFFSQPQQKDGRRGDRDVSARD
jgi:hypothetical protein